MQTIAFCEFDQHARKVLKKHWPEIPIYNDVRELDGTQFRESVDVVCGGFPCQDLSTAGRQAGVEGERSSLYREMLRIIGECLPRYAIFENVTGLLTGDSGRWFGQFLYDLAEIGYDAEWHCISASFIGAPHHRDRVWVIAYPASKPERGLSVREETKKPVLGECCKDVASSSSIRQQGPWKPIERKREETPENRKASVFESVRISREWRPEPAVGRVANGIPNRSHRLKQLGNSVVPQIPEAIGRAIMKVERC